MFNLFKFFEAHCFEIIYYAQYIVDYILFITNKTLKSLKIREVYFILVKIFFAVLFHYCNGL